MARRVFHVLWYGFLLGLTWLVVDKVTGGMTGGLKTGLGKSLGL